MSIIEMYNIIALQETHLSPALEKMLKLPHGFSFHSRSRNRPLSNFDSPQDGVAFLVRSHLSISVHDDISSQDILVLSASGISLVSVYIPPKNSRLQHSDPLVAETEDRFLTLLQVMSAVDSPAHQQWLVIGDLNACSSSLSCCDCLHVSVDVSASARGWQILHLCRNAKLHLLNGDIVLDNNPAMSSFQPQGTALVDYTMPSQELYIHVLSFATLAPSLWSDHAPLSGPRPTPIGCPTPYQI